MITRRAVARTGARVVESVRKCVRHSAFGLYAAMTRIRADRYRIPRLFFIDIDICMNCGYCAEYCPFDAIKMDHDYELASYDRTSHHIHDKDRLSKPASYWESIAPTRAYEEMLVRGTWEHKDVAKEARRGASGARSTAATSAAQAATVPSTTEAPAKVEATSPQPAAASAAEGTTPWSEDEAKREERRRKALERKAKRAAKRGE